MNPTDLITDDWIKKLQPYRRLVVGFSGGLDSCVLLHALAQCAGLKDRLFPVHIHHGLSPQALVWQNHCAAFCAALNLPFEAHSVTFDRTRNLEENAREARYLVLNDRVSDDDALLVAHHADDQAETVLLQWMRGTGVDGLAAMLPCMPRGRGVLCRPLLDKPRAQLEAYAQAHALVWVEDDSNVSLAFSRNYLRAQVIPRLRERWPNLLAQIHASAQHCQEAVQNLDDLAAIDCADLENNRLSLAPLRALSKARLVNVLRCWFKKNHIRRPTQKNMDKLIHEVIGAGGDRTPLLRQRQWVIRRYQDVLYLLPPEESAPIVTHQSWVDFPKACPWLEEDWLRAVPSSTGVYIPPGASLHVTSRQGGETFHWRGQTKCLKKLFQQWNIPPWWRYRVPLVYVNGQLAAVVGYAIHDASEKHVGVPRYDLQWQRGV